MSGHRPGFDPAAAPDPQAAPHRLRPGGRGLVLNHRDTDNATPDNLDHTFPPHGGTVVTLGAGIPRSRA